MFDKFMVFDVESIGLHGEGFAVGYVVVDRSGNRLAEAVYACDPLLCRGTRDGREWVAANIPTLSLTHPSPKALRAHFWADWMRWKPEGAVLAADVAWPVEARFLAECIDDERPRLRGDMGASAREWEGPYPLIDISSVRYAAGLDPLENGPRQDEETPIHNPLSDARQSARLLIEALRRGVT